MITEFVFIVGVFGALRFNSSWERRLQARRKLHGLVHPLSHYLGLLDHELQNDTHNPDPLVSQAVLDHVTELRSFLIRGDSYDLKIWGAPSWIKSLNSVLIRLEDSLETAIQGDWDNQHEVVQKDVRNLLMDLQGQAELKYFLNKKVGLVEP